MVLGGRERVDQGEAWNWSSDLRANRTLRLYDRLGQDGWVGGQIYYWNKKAVKHDFIKIPPLHKLPISQIKLSLKGIGYNKYSLWIEVSIMKLNKIYISLIFWTKIQNFPPTQLEETLSKKYLKVILTQYVTYQIICTVFTGY